MPKKVSEQEKIKIHDSFIDGLDIKKLSELYGFSIPTITKQLKNKLGNEKFKNIKEQKNKKNESSKKNPLRSKIKLKEEDLTKNISTIEDSNEQNKTPYMLWGQDDNNIYLGAIDDAGASVYIREDGSNVLSFTGGKASFTNAVTSSLLLVEGVSNYQGIEIKGDGASRPQLKFRNVNQGTLGQIYGTEGNALVIATGTGGTTAITVDSSQNVTLANGVVLDSSSDTLSRYDEGEATIYMYTNNGNKDNAAWTNRSGYAKMSYVRVGDMVTCQGKFELQGQNNASTSNSDAVLFELPFTVYNGTDKAGECAGTIAVNRFAHGLTQADMNGWYMLAIEDSTVAYIVSPSLQSGTEQYLGGASDGNWEGQFSITYRTQ